MNERNWDSEEDYFLAGLDRFYERKFCLVLSYMLDNVTHLWSHLGILDIYKQRETEGKQQRNMSFKFVLCLQPNLWLSVIFN